MSGLLVAQILFWVLMFGILTTATIWVAITERNDRHQEELARQHRRDRYKAISDYRYNRNR